MPKNENGTEQTVKQVKKIALGTISKLLKFILPIILVLILLVACLKTIFKDDVADKSSNVNKLYNREIYNEYKIC